LTLFVIPLGILRNAFRILTISLLTIHWDPGVIHGPLHHRGGPVFFAISLIPFFGVLWVLKWAERRGEAGSGKR
jgi:exosortase/archaeosortase family protein